MIQANLGNSTSGGSKGRAFDEMEAQRVRAPKPSYKSTKAPAIGNELLGRLPALLAAGISSGPPQSLSPHSKGALLA